MAGCYLKHIKPSWEVSSAGTQARDGEPASRFAQAAMKEEGLDLSSHRSSSLSGRDFSDFDRILVMTPRHLDFVPSNGELLSELRGDKKAVRDPFGGSLSIYRETFREIRYYLDSLQDEPGEDSR